MAQVNVNVEMNEKLKQKFEDTCDAIGLNMEEAFNIFAQKVVNEKGIPFEVKEEDYPRTPTAGWKQQLKKIAVISSIAAVCGAIAALVLSRKSRD